MDAGTLATLAAAFGIGGIIAAAINSYANKKRVGADAAQIITGAAGSIVALVKAELEETQAELVAERTWREEAMVMLRHHEDWDHQIYRALKQVVPPVDMPPPPPLVPRRPG